MAAKLKTSFDDLVGEVEMRKRRERELEESEARLRVSEGRLQLAIEAAGLGIWDWDVEQDRLVWDDSMYRLYGVRKEEFSGAFDAWSRCLVPEDLARATPTSRPRCAASASSCPTSECGGRTAPSAPFAAWAQTIRGADGRPCAWSASTGTSPICSSAEREREELVARAAQAPGGPRSARREPHHRAARRQGGRGERQPGEERLPGQHVARDPHADERDPRLRAAAAARPDLGDDQKQKIDIIHSSGNHLLTLINDILEMSKIEAGRTTLTVEPFDLHALLNEVQLMFRELTGEKGLELTFELDPPTCRARCRATPARSGRC